MPSRIKRRDKPRDTAQPIENEGLSAPLEYDPEAWCTDRKPKFRM